MKRSCQVASEIWSLYCLFLDFKEDEMCARWTISNVIFLTGKLNIQYVSIVFKKKTIEKGEGNGRNKG